MKNFLGIDIGLSGAIVIQNELTITYEIMPLIKKELDVEKLFDTIKFWSSEKCHVVFERLGPIFGTSKTTAFSMGYQSGLIEMICVSQGMPFTKVPPKVWQAEMFQGIDEITRPSRTGKKNIRDTKAMALIAAKRLFPGEVSKFMPGKRTKEHDGIIDALLMSSYCRRHFA